MGDLSPDEVVLWQWGFVKITATLAYTWVVMAVLAAGSWLIGRRLESGPTPSRIQVVVEWLVEIVNKQISEITADSTPGRYVSFVGTLFVFIATSAILGIVPGFIPPTSSLSTTTALALCVMLAVPIYGIITRGVRRYFRNYLEPSPIMLPFNVIGEFSRTLALAVRLFGNAMSGTKVVLVILGVVPFFLPIFFRALGLITGLIQAYIFAVLAMIYIAAAVRSEKQRLPKEAPNG